MKNFENLLSLYLDKQDEVDKKIIRDIAYLAYKEGRLDQSLGLKDFTEKEEEIEKD